jgi:hypothetical protein
MGAVAPLGDGPVALGPGGLDAHLVAPEGELAIVAPLGLAVDLDSNTV